MSEGNVTRLRAVYSEWAKGNLAAGEELYAEDVIFAPLAEGREVVDRDGFRRFMHTFLRGHRETTGTAAQGPDASLRPGA